MYNYLQLCTIQVGELNNAISIWGCLCILVHSYKKNHLKKIQIPHQRPSFPLKTTQFTFWPKRSWPWLSLKVICQYPGICPHSMTFHKSVHLFYSLISIWLSGISILFTSQLLTTFMKLILYIIHLCFNMSFLCIIWKWAYSTRGSTMFALVTLQDIRTCLINAQCRSTLWNILIGIDRYWALIEGVLIIYIDVSAMLYPITLGVQGLTTIHWWLHWYL